MLLSKFTDQGYLKGSQYKTNANLNARIGLHDRFSTNPRGWFDWVFDTLDTLPPTARVLELGCGSGNLWEVCAPRIPPGWLVTLSDFSEGMLDGAREKLSRTGRSFAFCVVDAQQIPFPAGSFDIVIANHMLYHVPDRPGALAEIARVLGPSARTGRPSYLVASTFGPSHLREIDDWIVRYDPSSVTRGNLSQFTLDNGKDQLEPFFAEVAVHRHDDALEITEVGPLVEYIASVTRASGLSPAGWESLTRELEATLARSGRIRVTKDCGLFLARGPK